MEDLLNVSILLGLDYSPETRSSVILYLSSTTEKPLSLLVPLIKIFSTLLEKNAYDQLKLSKILKIPKSFLSLLVFYNRRQGICCICDFYYDNLKDHLFNIHFLSRSLFLTYYSLFKKKFFYFMPQEFEMWQKERIPESGLPGSKIMVRKTKIPEVLNAKKKVKYRPVDFVPNPELDKLDCVICEECGKYIPKSDKNNHTAVHQRNVILSCPNCERSIKRMYFNKHFKDCCRNREIVKRKIQS